MRSVISATVIALAVALLAAASVAGAQEAPAHEQQSVSSEPVTSDAIVRVLAQLEADPNIAPTKKVRVLRWMDRDREDRDTGGWGWLKTLSRWLLELFAWIAASGRVLVWVLAAVLVGFLAVFLYRLYRSGVLGEREGKFTAPSFVRDLDIRPESLPPDIGQAAWASWERGEHRAALALLYRGMLSRLVHVHGVPIRDSSTEGDCLALAGAYLRAERIGFVAKLIRSWQRAVYGGVTVESEVVRSLCTGFSAALDAADATDGPLAERAA